MQNHRTNYFAKLSLLSITLTVILASVTHAHQFGYRAFVACFVAIIVLSFLNIFYQRTQNMLLFALYGLLNAWVIVGFGIVNGFWNHGCKVFLHYLHGGYLPPFLAGLFLDPKIGNFFLESAGISTFMASMVALYCVSQMAPKKHNHAEINH